jgi:hypothetical protein
MNVGAGAGAGAGAAEAERYPGFERRWDGDEGRAREEKKGVGSGLSLPRT